VQRLGELHAGLCLGAGAPWKAAPSNLCLVTSDAVQTALLHAFSPEDIIADRYELVAFTWNSSLRRAGGRYTARDTCLGELTSFAHEPHCGASRLSLPLLRGYAFVNDTPLLRCIYRYLYPH